MQQTTSSRALADRARHLLRDNWTYLLVLAFLVLFPFLVAALTGSNPIPARARDAGESSYWQSIMIQLFVFAILAMSYNLMFGFTGVVSFGHALFFGMGAYTVGIGVKHLSMDFGVAVIAALAVSALLGLIMGLMSLRIKGVYFAIFTLAFAQVFFVLSRNRLLAPITGAEDGFFFTVPDWLNPVVANRLTYYYVTLIALVAVFVFVRRLVNSPTGRVFQGIRENEQRAQTIGYNTLTFKLLAIVIAGMIAALAGILHVVLNNKQPLPALLGATYTMDPLLSTLLGGTGTFIGPPIGAGVLYLGEVALRGLEITIGSTVIDVGDTWALFLGIGFIVVVMVFPSGIVGTWNQWRAKRRGSRSAHAGTSPPAAGD
ncbi:MAG: branched-chain amino acid ABC transporter permease [Anaerolineae bacterium]|nr:branched-chain amino acid ABC transporter permease [Anaerolineae bacterium]